jgi:hypothetical protein
LISPLFNSFSTDKKASLVGQTVLKWWRPEMVKGHVHPISALFTSVDMHPVFFKLPHLWHHTVLSFLQAYHWPPLYFFFTWPLLLCFTLLCFTLQTPLSTALLYFRHFILTSCNFQPFQVRHCTLISRHNLTFATLGFYLLLPLCFVFTSTPTFNWTHQQPPAHHFPLTDGQNLFVLSPFLPFFRFFLPLPFHFSSLSFIL